MRQALAMWLVGGITLLTAAVPVTAQDIDGLGDAILALPVMQPPGLPNVQQVDGRLYDGVIDALIIDQDGTLDNFRDGDFINISVASIGDPLDALSFSGTRAEFDAWVGQNAVALARILFPASLSQGTLGIDVAQAHSQQLVVSTVLSVADLGDISGRIEYESFDFNGDSGSALQGLFRVKAVSFEARYARVRDSLDTDSIAFGVSVNPSWQYSRGRFVVRTGPDAFFSTLYSRSNVLDLGSLDYGGGWWASARTSLSDVVSLGFGGLVLGSKSHIPTSLVDDAFDWVVEQMNDRPIRWDGTYGAHVQVRVSPRTTTGVKLVESRSLKPAGNQGRTSRLVLLNVAHLVGGDTLVDFGYRFSHGGDFFSAHGFYFNGNFDF